MREKKLQKESAKSAIISFQEYWKGRKRITFHNLVQTPASG